MGGVVDGTEHLTHAFDWLRGRAVLVQWVVAPWHSEDFVDLEPVETPLAEKAAREPDVVVAHFGHGRTEQRVTAEGVSRTA